MPYYILNAIWLSIRYHFIHITDPSPLNTARLIVNGRTVVNIKEGEDGSIYLLYKVKGEIQGVPIKASKKAPERTTERTPDSHRS